MAKAKMLAVALLALLFLAGTSEAQRGRGGGEKAMGPSVKEMTIIILDVGEASISYVEEGKPVRMSRGRISGNMVGVADVTRVVKPEWKPVTVKELEKGDRAILTLYEDPEDPYFPALAIKVIGKGEVKAPARGGRGGDRGGRGGGGGGRGSR